MTTVCDLDLNDVKKAVCRIQTGYRGFYGPAQMNSTGCFLATKKPNKGRKGWVKCKVEPLSKKEYYVHQLAFRLRYPNSKSFEPGKQISHLCHNPRCFNADHLITESAKSNRDRNLCNGWKWITCPFDETHSFNPCTHRPQCILPKNK